MSPNSFEDGVHSLSTEKHADEKRDATIKTISIVENGATITITPAINRRLLWKIDLHLLPLLCLLYGLQFLDKTTISYASVMGIRADTGLVGTQYNWLGSVFYIGYLFAEYPAVTLLQKLPISKFLSATIVLWGAILMCHAACTGFVSLVTLRVLLGILESAISPGFAMIVSQWWRKEEQGFRTGIWFCWNGTGQVFGAVVSYAISTSIKSNGYTDLKGWQLMFLMTGGLTVVCGILFLFLIPDEPSTSWFLTEEEKILCLERIRGNQQGVKNTTVKKYQVIEALTDPAAWLIVLFSFTSSIPNGALTNFKNVILQGFGLSDELSLLYGAPNGAVQIVATLSICYIADATKNRLYWSVFALIIPVIGFILLVTLPQSNLNGMLIAYYITSTASTAFTLLLSLISSNVAGQTKKATVSAMMFIGYCVGNLIGPQIINLNEAPRYVIPKAVICGLYGVCIGQLLALRWVFVWRNNKKERKMTELGNAYVHQENQEFMDLTDGENLE